MASPTTDRCVAALRNAGHQGTDSELGAVAALVLRVVRDDLALAALDGRVQASPGIERYLNARIGELGTTSTTTGDTALDNVG